MLASWDIPVCYSPISLTEFNKKEERGRKTSFFEYLENKNLLGVKKAS